MYYETMFVSVNYLLLEAFDVYGTAQYDDILADLLPNQPGASLSSVAQAIRQRLVSIFAIDESTQERPVNRGMATSCLLS